MKHKSFLYSSIISVGILVILVVGCRKIDLQRIAAVSTGEVTGITSSQATVYGNVIDLGEEERINDVGFCWAINRTPTLADDFIRLGSASSKGSYSVTVNGLLSNTNYTIRAFADDGEEIHYGNAVKFTTDFGMTSGEWLHYDDGQNADGIGLVEGGTFDYAIRFPVPDLVGFDGFSVSKIRFYPKTGSPVEYYMTLWEGSGNPDLLYDEMIPNITADTWNEYYPTFNYIIDGSTELWIGIWVVNSPAAYYPAGCDNGPAITGYGDMFSTDDGATWDALSVLNPDLNYNWNLQVYVTDSKGKSAVLTRKGTKQLERQKSDRKNTGPAKVTNGGKNKVQR